MEPAPRLNPVPETPKVARNCADSRNGLHLLEHPSPTFSEPIAKMPQVKNPVLVVALVGATILCAAWVWDQWQLATNGLEPRPEVMRAAAGAPPPGAMARSAERQPDGPPGGGRGAGPFATPEDRERMATELGLTPEQRAQIEELTSSPPPADRDARRERMEKMRAILTPEQQKKMRESMRSRFEGREARRTEEARKRLSPEEFDAYQRRREAIRARIESGQSPWPGAPAPPEGGFFGRGRGSRQGQGS